MRAVRPVRDALLVADAAREPRHRIVAAMLVADRQVLLCHRSATKQWCPGVWDLPGGHVEAGEAPGAALARELREELRIDVVAPEEVGCARLLTDQLEMQVWRIIEWTGSPRNAAPEEHDEIAWFSLSAARAVDLAHDRYLDLFEEALSLR